MEKLYRVQMNSKGVPDFSTAVEAEDKPSVDKDYLIRLIQEAVYDGEACARLLDLVDRPQGEWDFIGDNMFRCTSCGEVYSTHQFENLRTRNTDPDPFFPRGCPHCGARMKGAIR